MSEKNSKKSFSLFVVDAFAEKPFEGNSAAVVLLPHSQALSREIKQKIATEMNLSETAFITLKCQEDSFQNANLFKLEWFTPTCEVKLCGHATMASAAVLFMCIGNKSNELYFETLSGVLKARHFKDNKIGIDLPASDSKPVGDKYEALVKAVVGSLVIQDVALSDTKKLIIRLSDEITRKDLESIRIKDDELLSAASDVIDVIVTLKTSDKVDCVDSQGQQFDFISRVFAPWLGISEDPVTGSAQAVLAPYWSKVMKKNNFYARQCSPRGGNLNVDLIKDRAHISGNAVIVIQGQINV